MLAATWLLTLTAAPAQDAARLDVNGLDPHALNTAAVEAYRAGDLATARTHWSTLLAAGANDAERARLCYDLGNVACRAGRYPEAVGWYSAAQRLAPRDADVWANLEFARREAGLEPADRGDLSATLRRLLEAPTPREAELLLLAALTGWAGILAFEALRGGRWGRRLALAGGLGVALAAAPLAWQSLTAERDPVLTIAAREVGVAVRSEPRAEAALIAQLGPGERLERLGTHGDWTELALPDGGRGWARSDTVFALHR